MPLKPTPSLVRGVAIGLFAGLLGSVAKIAGEAIYQPRTLGQTPPPLVLAQRYAKHPLTPPEQNNAIQTIHYVFGALSGGIYGAAAEFLPIVTVGYGSVFGIVLQLLTHETLRSSHGPGCTRKSATCPRASQ